MTLAHQILVAEGIFSAIVAVALVAWANQIHYIPEVFIISLTWNLAFLGLLFAGIEHDAWQYWVLGAYGMLSLLVCVYNGVTRKRVKLDSPVAGTVIFVTLMAIGQTWLLVSAA